MRYEALSLPEPLPQSLERIAWAADGSILALHNRTKPHWALLFQPAAYGSEQGRELVRNFYTFALQQRTGKPAQQLEWILPAKPLATLCVTRSQHTHTHANTHNLAHLCFIAQRTTCILTR